MKKRLLAAFLAALMIFSLFSCTKEEPATESTTDEGNQPVTISDEEAIDKFLADMKNGVYDDQKMYGYDDLSVYFKPGTYTGLTFPDDPLLDPTVTKEEAEDYLKMIYIVNVLTDEEFETLTEGVVQKFDSVHLTYEGTQNGKVIDRATGEEKALLIGSGTFIPGFEEGLIGKKIGQKVPLDLSLSPYYEDDEMAGTTVHFEAVVKEITRPKLPELTVETFNEMYGTDYKDMDALLEDLRADMEAENEETAHYAVLSYLQNKIIKSSEIGEMPEKEMEFYRKKFTEYFESAATDAELSLEEYVKTEMGLSSLDEFYEDVEEYARESVLADLFVLTIAKKENLSVTDEQIRSMIEGYYQSSAGNFSNLYSMLTYYISIQGPFFFENTLLSSVVQDFIYQSAVKEG